MSSPWKKKKKRKKLYQVSLDSLLFVFTVDILKYVIGFIMRYPHNFRSRNDYSKLPKKEEKGTGAVCDFRGRN